MMDPASATPMIALKPLVNRSDQLATGGTKVPVSSSRDKQLPRPPWPSSRDRASTDGATWSSGQYHQQHQQQHQHQNGTRSSSQYYDPTGHGHRVPRFVRNSHSNPTMRRTPSLSPFPQIRDIHIQAPRRGASADSLRDPRQSQILSTGQPSVTLTSPPKQRASSTPAFPQTRPVPPPKPTSTPTKPGRSRYSSAVPPQSLTVSTSYSKQLRSPSSSESSSGTQHTLPSVDTAASSRPLTSSSNQRSGPSKQAVQIPEAAARSSKNHHSGPNNSQTPSPPPPAPPLPPAPGQSILSQTQYMRMLLSLDKIPRLHNILVSCFAWILLAGFVILPGSFTNSKSLEELDSHDSDAQPNTHRQNPFSSSAIGTRGTVVAAVGLACIGIGATGAAWLAVRWRKNYVWLLNKLYMPLMLNGLAGVVATFTHVYTGQQRGGRWPAQAVVAIGIEAGILVLSALLFAVYNFWLLRWVRHEHDRQVHMGMTTAAATAATTTTTTTERTGGEGGGGGGNNISGRRKSVFQKMNDLTKAPPVAPGSVV